MKRALIILSITLALILGHYTDIYATHLNGGIVIGSVGIELWGHPGLFVCTGQC